MLQNIYHILLAAYITYDNIIFYNLCLVPSDIEITEGNRGEQARTSQPPAMEVKIYTKQECNLYK